jgi:RimJ/RimL family protein N-acetyltransferase
MGGPRDRSYLVETFEDDLRNPPSSYDLWPVIEKASSQLVGHCGLLDKNIDGVPEIELVYVFARSAWGKGYATEMALALKKYAREQMGLNRLVALIDPENAASERVAVKAGVCFEREITRPGGKVMQLYTVNGEEEMTLELRFDGYMIRDWRREDAPSIAKYANNRKIWINLRDAFPHPYHLSDAEAFLSRILGQEPRTIFAIATDAEAIGSIGFMFGEDVHRFTAELGYWLAEPYWNRGIMTEAVRRLTDYAFETFDLVRIYAEPYASNLASIRVLEKAGFQYEGRLKDSVYKDGKILDQVLYARTKLT